MFLSAVCVCACVARKRTHHQTPPTHTHTLQTRRRRPPPYSESTKGTHEVALDRHIKVTPAACDALRRELHQVKPDGEGFFRALLNSDGADVVLYTFTLTHPHARLGMLGRKQHVTLGFKDRAEAVAWCVCVCCLLRAALARSPLLFFCQRDHQRARDQRAHPAPRALHARTQTPFTHTHARATNYRYIAIGNALGDVAATDPEWTALKKSGSFAGHGAARLQMSWQAAM